MKKILVSACLLGEKVRYHGGHEKLSHPLLDLWQQEGRLVSICPEVAGGFPVPREPSEILGSGGGAEALNQNAKVIKKSGEDVTSLFIKGAELALQLAKKHDIQIALLKEDSPSCGSKQIYSGNFDSQKIPGQGVTAALLKQNDIRVFSEDEIEGVLALL